MIADAPIFMVLGNHDLSLFSDKNIMEIIERFMSLIKARICLVKMEKS